MVAHDALNVTHVVAATTLTLGVQKAGQEQGLSGVEVFAVPDVCPVHQAREFSVVALLAHVTIIPEVGVVVHPYPFGLVTRGR